MFRRALGLCLIVLASLSSPSHAAPVISTPASLSFGSVTVQAFSQLNLTIQNNGNETLIVNSVGFIGSTNFSAPFLPPGPFPVAPGGSAFVVVRFTPTTRGAKTGSIVLQSNDPVTPNKTVSLSGTGVAPVLNVVPAPNIDFGLKALNSSSLIQVDIRNFGDAGQNLVVSSIQVSGHSSFSLTGLPTLPASIPAGNFTSFEVQFEPTEEGSVAGSLHIACNDPATPTKTIDLFGTGIGAVIGTDPEAIDFGEVVLLSVSEMPFSIRNDSFAGIDLVVDSVSITGPDAASFSLTGFPPPLPVTISSGESASGFSVRFSPVSLGMKTAAIAIHNNSASSPVKTIDLAGTVNGAVGTPAGTPVFALRVPVPNPAQGHARFDFSLPEAGPATLAIFDVLGRHVATLVNGPRAAGPQSVRWETSGVRNGVYFARLVAARKTASLRFAVLP